MVLALGACDSEGPAEKADKQLDNATTRARQAVEDAAEKARGNLEAATKAAEGASKD
jgi:vacuolar-type H+-ATPase subunit H